MKIKNRFDWLTTWISLSMLKKSLKARLEGAAQAWLQPVKVKKPLIFNRVDFIMDQCRNKKLLHIGFTDYPYTMEKLLSGQHLHVQLKKVTHELLGLDVEEKAIADYSLHTNDQQVVAGNILKAYPETALNFAPELILLSEVLEHLQDPYKAVNILYDSFSDGTTILVTVPNYASLDSIAASLHHTESVHPHHHWYFSPYTLQQLFDERRFKLISLHFGMYYQPRTRINAVMKQYPFNGDCIIAIFTITKPAAHG